MPFVLCDTVTASVAGLIVAPSVPSVIRSETFIELPKCTLFLNVDPVLAITTAGSTVVSKIVIAESLFIEIYVGILPASLFEPRINPVSLSVTRLFPAMNLPSVVTLHCCVGVDGAVTIS